MTHDYSSERMLTPAEEADIKGASACIRAGGVIVYPTDTVWGIGCDATNPHAVAKVYALKGRAESKAVISLVGSWEALYDLTGVRPDNVENVSEDDRPVTVIYPEANKLCPEVKASDGSAAIRLTREVFSSALCVEAGVPLVSTSANRAGDKVPECFPEIDPSIIDGADYVCRSRRTGENACQGSRPSKIIKLLKSGQITLIRP